MLKQRTFWASVIVLIILATLHFLGAKFYWYWTYRWFDIPMHMLGGAWLALTSFWLASYFGQAGHISIYRLRSFFLMLFAVLSIGIFWELFELVGGINSFTDIGYWPDTWGDLLNDFIGGLVSFLYFIKRKKCGGLNVCEPHNMKIFVQ